jgi:YD repeat-containing protein
MKTLNVLLIVACAALAPMLFASTYVNSDITTDTTWDRDGQPYRLNANGLKVRNGATLTIDTSGGNVEIDFRNTGRDFQIGNGSGDEGFLVLKAESGEIQWRFRNDSNLIIDPYGQVRTFDATGLNRFGSGGYNWGAVVFSAGQTMTSTLEHCRFYRGGNDSKDGALLIENSAANTPQLENLEFHNCTTSAIRFEGNGINTLRQDGLKLPLSVDETTYVFYLNAVTSTVPIRFPDADTSSTPTAYLSGTCTVGDSNESSWQFDDGYTFKCAASSKVQVTHGFVRGTTEAMPTFESVSGSPGFSDWVGLVDTSTTYSNVSGGLGAFAHLEVRDASYGVDLDKYSDPSAIDGLPYVLSDIVVQHCTTAIRTKSTIEDSVVLRRVTTGGTSTADEINGKHIHILAGTVRVENCECIGNTNITFDYGIYAEGTNSDGYHVTASESRFTDFYVGIFFYSSQGSGTGVVERCLTEANTVGIHVYQYGYNQPRTTTIRHCCSSSDFVGVDLNNNDTTGTFAATIEDSTFVGDGAANTFGIRGYKVPASPSSVSIARCNLDTWQYGILINSFTENLCEYSVDECNFTSNTYGIYDLRTQTAKAVVSHCTFNGNSTYGAADSAGGSASTDMLAEDCYWGADDGPSGSGPGSGDAVNANVDYDPFLERAYIGVLIGGSPASASVWDVWENSSTDADNLHIIAGTPYFKWSFASDFAGDTQSAYEIEVDDNADFGSKTWDTGKTSSTASGVGGPNNTFTGGTLYYARIRLWNDEDLPGPWRYLTFRLNNVPGTVGNTNRTPANSSSQTDWTPVFVWERPADTNEDPLHFELVVYKTFGIGTPPAYTARTWTSGAAVGATPATLNARNHFEISVDDGATWTPFPSDGAPAGDTIRVRMNWPDEWGLSDATVPGPWNWYVRAYDSFGYGTAASTWTFTMGRSYTISGQLQDNSGAGLNSKTMRLYINGVDSGDTDDTQTVSSVDGRFDIVTTDALEVGDVLWVYVDGETEKGAAVFHFTGDSMTWAGESIVVRAERAYVYGTVDGLVFSNADFEITTADTDIPWTYSSGTVTFKSTLDGAGDGLHLQGQLDMSGALDGTTSLDVELNVGTSGHLRTQGYNASFHKLANNGILEVLDGSTLTLDGSNSTTSGTFVLDGSTLKFAGSSALSLKVAKGTFDSRNSATIQDLTANVSELLVDSTTAAAPAVLSCADTTFDEVGLTVETDGVLALFNDNIFQNDVSAQHIYWKSESALSATQMRGVQFNTSLNGVDTFNIQASSTANNINMLGCGGVGQGEAFDLDSSSKVDWELTPPTGLRLTLGDTRIRADWDANDQVDASAFGFNLYKALVEDGTWTSAPSYEPISMTTDFVDSNANFTSALIGATFYPDASSTASLTVLSVPSSTSIRVSGDHSGAASNGDPYSFFVKVNGSLLTDTHDEAESLTNGTTYYFYLTIDDSTEDAPLSRNRGEEKTLAPAASSISAVSPDNADATSVLALSVIGDDTHWESSTTVTITKGGGSGVTVNDTLIISAKLALVDATLSSATTGTWTVTATENDIWGIAAYDEVETANLTVNANDADVADRPTLVFSTNNGGIAADSDTSGSFIFNIDFTDQGGGVDTTNLEIFASRDVTISSANKTAGTELIGAGLSIDTLNDSRATCTINQTAGTELFADGEYTLTARVADDYGNYSEWATRRFYVEGAASDVAKTGELLHQGDTELTFMITGTFSTTVDGVDFGSGITTVSYNKDSGTEITVTVTVAESAACGPRTFTVDMTTGTDPVGVIIVEYPTNILPTVNNDEPSRNPAIGGVNVFLVNGEFFKSETDLAVRGRMMGISWSRFYRSQITYDGPLGHGWVGHYFQRAVIDSGTSDIWWYTPDGRKEVFPDIAGGYSSPAGVYVTASSENTHGTITLTDRHGYRCVFNADGRLWRCIDRNGNTTECSYNYAGQLTTIYNDLRETFTIAYQSTGRVDTASDNMWNDGTTGHTAARQVEYEYDSEGNLVEQKAPTTSRYDGSPYARTTYGYAYDSAHNLTRCINPREFAESSEPVAYLENFYDSSDRVIDQKLGDEADVLDSHITKSAFIRLRYESSTLIHEIDRNGHRTDYTIDGTGRATTVSRYTGFYSVDTDEPIVHSTVSTVLTKLRGGDPTSFDTEFTYNSNHEILSITYPRDNKVTYEYPSGSSQTSGTCTSDPTDTVLADTGKSWTPDAYIGMILRVGSNAGEYAYYPIVDNDATTITIESSGFSMALDGWASGEDYAVYDEASDPMAAGNVLSVTRSDEGLGSESDIVTSYTYEPRYQFVKTVTDPRGNATSYSYDYEESAGNGADAGNLVLVTSPTITGSMASSAAITTRTTYNEYGQPVTMVDGEGNVTYLKYYTSGSHNGFLYQRISAWGELDLTSEFEYDPVGNLTASWSPRAFESGATKDDYKTAYEVNELNQTWHVTGKYEVGSPVSSSLASVDSYRYFDANGNLTHSYQEYITDSGTSPSVPGDLITPGTFSKASSAMAATWVETTYEYNLLNYQTKVTRDQTAGSAVYRVASETRYDSNYNVIESVSPLGNRNKTRYDERDLVFQRIAGADSDVQGTYQTDYDANGNVSTSYDALGNATTYDYDGFDRTTKVTDAGGNYRTSAYDSSSNVTTSSAYDVFGTLLVQSTSTYDQINRAYVSARLAKDHNGIPIGDGWNTSTTVFDKNSRMISSTNDNGVTNTSYYDAANRTTETRDAVGNRTLYTYNANGATEQVDYIETNGLNGASEPSHVSYILNRSDVAWEVRDRRWSTSFDTSGYTKRDGWGRVTVSTDAAGTDTLYEYDLLSRQTQVTRKPTATGTDWTVTQSVYDDDSRTVTTRISKNPNINTSWQETDFEYDERSRVVTRRRPDGDIWSYNYDVNSNLIERTDPLGTRVTNTYDSRNLLAYRNIERGTGIVGPTYESYEYDGLARLTACSNYDGSDLIAANACAYNTLSLKERCDQTTASSTGNILATHTIKAEYDASGFRTATVYWDGRRVENFRDQMDRLSHTVDETNNQSIAVYVYAGANRVVEKTYGNGTRASYTYESSGCGCGGATTFIDRVEHNLISTGETLFGIDKRYDVTGNLTAERLDHEGDLGVVYRRDDTYRLTNTYYGVDLTSTALATYADPANTPSAFGLKRAYTLDPRSNRSSVIDTDDGSTTVYNYAYTLSTDENDLYTAVDGDDYSYDAIEQRTYDDATGLYYAYDYRGYLWLCDTDSAKTTPEQIFHHDALGNRVLEEGWYDDAPSTNVHKTVLVNDIRGGGGCGSNSGEPKAGEVRYNASDVETSNVQYVHGKGQGSIVQELADNGTSTVFRYRHEDQAGSLIGVTDEDGARTDEYFYLDFGTPVHRPVAFDGNLDRISSVQANTPSAGYTRVNLTGVSLTADAYNGKQARVLGSLHITEVYDTASTSIDLADPDGSLYTLLNNGADFVVLDFESPATELHATGDWEDVYYDEINEWTVFVDEGASFTSTVALGDSLLPDTNDPNTWLTVLNVDSDTVLTVAGDVTAEGGLGDNYEVWLPIWSYASGVSTYTNPNASFESWMLGWLFTPDVNEPCYLQVIEVTSSTSVKVKGDARGLSNPDDEWRIHAPPGVDQSTGGLHTDLITAGSRYLYSRMRYIPPQVGFDVLGTIEGTQGGAQLSGNHLDRGTFDPGTGVLFGHVDDKGGWVHPKRTRGEDPPPQKDGTKTGGPSADEIIEKARKEREQKRADQAIDCYEACSERYPEPGDVDDLADCKRSCSQRFGFLEREYYGTGGASIRGINAADAIIEASKYNEKNPNWWTKLPDCPCTNPDINAKGERDPTRDESIGWASEGSNSYHPGAAECFRSYPTASNGLSLDGPGQQCCYDSNHQLITSGSGAGTPDRHNTAEGEDGDGDVDRYWGGVAKHSIDDVLPHGALGWKVYNKYWPPNKGKDCPDNEVTE